MILNIPVEKYINLFLDEVARSQHKVMSAYVHVKLYLLGKKLQFISMFNKYVKVYLYF